MKITTSNNYINLYTKKRQEKPQSFGAGVKNPLSKLPPKVKTGALAGFFLLPVAGGVVSNCTGNNNKIQIVDSPADISMQEKYLEKSDRTFYVVSKGDIPEKIAKKYNISTRRLLFENGLDKKTYIHPNDTLLIPESYQVKNVETLEDVAKLTGFNEDYLKDLCKMEEIRYEPYEDRNKKETIGVGHYIKPDERKKFSGKTLSDEQVYTLLAQDLFDRDLNLKTIVNAESYNDMPVHLKEQVMDLVFNKGEGAVEGNKMLLKALNEKDYAAAVANLTQDYSVVTDAKGNKVRKPASGLSKRRLYNMAQASKIFKNGMPDVVLESAEKVYKRGLIYLQQERDRGEISKEAYPNVLAEYKALAYQWYDGKLGEEIKTPKSKSSPSSPKESAPSEAVSAVRKAESQKKTVDTSASIYINGEKTKWTVKTLYEDWEKTAARQLRYVKRPMPEIDKNGNIKAYVKTLDPTGKGAFSGKTILINPGHGGCMNHKERDGSLNVNFDPGTSNAVMSKKNKNVETNVFKGNGGKSLEEWVVNQRIADELVEKIRKEGAKVVYVQGSVYSAQKAIRQIQSNQKVNLIVSLHSNSSGASRGIFVIGNKRGGIDKEDKKLVETITAKMNEHSWFRGITHQTEQSLGVLSASRKKTSPVPAVLIETGNLKNESDVANLNSRTFKSQMIESIFEGLKEYLK